MADKNVSEYHVEIVHAGNVTAIRVVCYSSNPDGTERRTVLGHKEVAEDKAVELAKELDDAIYSGVRHAIETSNLFAGD